jgi:hypothetical protein
VPASSCFAAHSSHSSSPSSCISHPPPQRRNIRLSSGDGISVLIAKAGSRDPDDQGPDYVLTVKDKNDVEIFSIRNGLDDVK